MTTTRDLVADQRDQFAFHDDIVYLAETKRGLTRDTVEEISRFKDEPEWMLQFRLRAYDHFVQRAMPAWAEGLDKIDFDKIVYYRKPSEREEKSWDDVPEQIKQTFERLGIPEAERKFLAGVGAQYDSEVVYHSVREELTKIGVVFMGTDQALKEYPEIFKKYFGTIVPPEDNKFAALNSAVWSGGSFVYVPKGVEVPLPLQAYFRINGENTGQFERTLIVVDEGAKVHYIEGCTAPIYATDSLHAAVVEVVALPGSKVRYTTIQNWSQRRLQPRDQARPCVRVLDGRVDRRQHRLARRRSSSRPSTCAARAPRPTSSRSPWPVAASTRTPGPRPSTSPPTPARGSSPSRSRRTAGGRRIAASSRSPRGPRTSWPASAATRSCSTTRAAATRTRTSTSRKTTRRCRTRRPSGKVSADQVFYLMARGLTENEATNLIVQGFLEVFTKELPMEYAIEFNRLVKLEMEGSLG